MEEAAKRRSRWSYHGTDAVQLTERDIGVLSLLNRYRYLDSSDLHAHIGGDKTAFVKRLGLLKRAPNRFLNCPRQQMQYANANYRPLIYELTSKGEQVLRESGEYTDDRPMLRNGRMGAVRNFAHEVMACKVVSSIELGTKTQDGVRFISWKEIMRKAPERTQLSENPIKIPVPRIEYVYPKTKKRISVPKLAVVPDGLFGIEYTDGERPQYRFFVLEADRATMPVSRNNLNQNSYLKKFLAYREIISRNIYHEHFGIPNLFVLTVTTKERHMRSIMDLLGQLTEQGSTRFLFKYLTTLGSFDRAAEPSPAMLTEPWQRVGNNPLDISNS